MSKLQYTKEYDKFESITGNRSVYDRHVSKLVETILEQNLLEYFPIVVNEHMQVIDGQHRLQAAKSAGIEVPYVVIEGLDIEDVQRINTAQRSWTLSDWVNSYIARGNDEYVYLRAFKERYGVAWSVAVRLLSGEGHRANDMTHGDIIRSGKFKAENKDHAQKVIEYVEAVTEYANFNALSSTPFILAMTRAIEAPGFTVNRLIGKLQDHNLTLEYQVDVKHYVLELERIYNYRASNRVELLV